MPTLKKQESMATEYRGKQTKTGNSGGFRFEGALFKSHPEFKGDVKARVIAPGRLLVTADALPQPKADPVMASFLAFLAQDMVVDPAGILPLDAKLVKRMKRLVKGIAVAPDEDLGDGTLL